MHLEAWRTDASWEIFSRSSFTCENDQKVFYKLMKDCSRFRIEKNLFMIYVNTPGSAGFIFTNRIRISFSQLYFKDAGYLDVHQ